VATIFLNVNNAEGSHESGLTDGIQIVPSSGIPTADHASLWAGCRLLREGWALITDAMAVMGSSLKATQMV
jgi:hypothetical protein